MKIPNEWVKVAENDNAVVYKTHTLQIPTITGDWHMFKNDYTMVRDEYLNMFVYEVEVHRLINKNHKVFSYDETTGGYSYIMERFNQTEGL